MPPERFPPDDPRAWLAAAADDLALARADVPGLSSLEPFCFHAQQAAEKAIKAVLLSLGVDFPRSHNLVLLLHLARFHGLDVPADVEAAGYLSVFAVSLRYPGPPDEPVDPEERAEAVTTAVAVLRWANAIVRPPAS